MFSKSKNFKSEYCCSIIKIGEVKPIEGKDKIGYTLVNGETIVIRKDQVKEGDILFYASNETQLHKDFLGANNLFESGSYELNANAKDVEPYILKNKELKPTVEILEKAIKKLEVCSNFLLSYDAEILAAGDNETKKEELITRYDNSRRTIMKFANANLTLVSSNEDFVKIANKTILEKKFALEPIKKEIEDNTNFVRSHVGFFNKTGRVRAIRLGGINSMGYLFSIDELAKWCPEVKNVYLPDLVGEDFDMVNGIEFIKAYVPFVPQRSNKGDGKSIDRKRNKKIEKFDRMIKGEFSFHYSSDPLPKCINRIKANHVGAITVKAHGGVEKNTIVNTMEYGDKTIGEIVDNKVNCHIKAYDTDTNEIVYVPIDNFYTIPNDGEWYEIELENGKKITITGNNPIWLPELGIYRRVDELNGDEKILFSDD